MSRILPIGMVLLFISGSVLVGHAQRLSEPSIEFGDKGTSIITQVGSNAKTNFYLQTGTTSMWYNKLPLTFFVLDKKTDAINRYPLTFPEKKTDVKSLMLQSENGYTFIYYRLLKGQASLTARKFDAKLNEWTDKQIFSVRSLSLLKEMQGLAKYGELMPKVSDNLRYAVVGLRYRTFVYDAVTDNLISMEHPEGWNLSFHVLNDGRCFAFREYGKELRLDQFSATSAKLTSIKFPTKPGDMVVSVKQSAAQGIYAVVLTGKGELHGDFVEYRKAKGAVNTGPYTEAKTRANGFRAYRLSPENKWEQIGKARFKPATISQLESKPDGLEWLTVEQVESNGKDTYVVLQQRHEVESELISNRMEDLVVMHLTEGSTTVNEIPIPRQCWVSNWARNYEETYFRWHEGRPLIGYYESTKWKEYRFTFHFLDERGMSNPKSVDVQKYHNNLNRQEWWNAAGTVYTQCPFTNSWKLGTLDFP